MRWTLFLAVLLPFGIQAQVVDSNTKSISIFGEWNTAYSVDYPYMSTVGVMYKWRRKENVSYTASVGYCRRNSKEQIGVKHISGNVSSISWRASDIGLAVAGFGIERQRHFYKKVYFFAGLEGRVGYGGGNTEYVDERETWVPPVSGAPPSAMYGTIVEAEYTYSGSGMDIFIVHAAPYIGAKLEFKRITLGLNVMNYIRFEAEDGGPNNNSLDINTANFYKRLFVAYKF